MGEIKWRKVENSWSLCRFTSLTVFWLRARMISADAPRTKARFIFNRVDVKFHTSMNQIHHSFRSKLNVLLYSPSHQRRTLGSRWRLCCRPSPRGPPRSTAPALWCRPRLFLRSPASLHPEPEDRKQAERSHCSF